MPRVPKRPILLALQGSPRLHGATSELLNAFLSSVRGWKIIRLDITQLNIPPYFPMDPRPFPKDAQINFAMEKVFALFKKADALVLASPVYFYSFPAQVKALIDQCHPLWHDTSWRNLKKRPGYFLSTCAMDKKTAFNIILKEARAFFNTIGFKLLSSTFIRGLDETDAEERIERGKKRAMLLGKRIDYQLYHE